MKKILLISLLFLSVFLLAPSLSQAKELLPLVQCGGDGQPACTFCSFFDMINRIVQFIMTRIVPAVAVLMLVIGGVMFFFGGANPKTLQTAKDIIKATVIGLVIISAAFVIVGSILSAIGLADWTTQIYKNWWQNGFFQIPGC